MPSDEAIAKGLEVEREHENTYRWLKGIVEGGGKLPSAEEFYASIALDHIEEIEDYYDRLEEMEREALGKLDEGAYLKSLVQNQFFSKNPHTILKDPSYIQDYEILDNQGKPIDVRGNSPEWLLVFSAVKLWKYVPEEVKRQLMNKGLVTATREGATRAVDWKKNAQEWLKNYPDLRNTLENIVNPKATKQDVQRVADANPEDSRQMVHKKAFA